MAGKPEGSTARAMAAVDLDDKYTLDEGRIFLTGVQALVRLPLIQKRRDRAAGKNTAGFISGYRGSPLGGYDQQLWRAKTHLKSHDIHFQPGVNEELAATACWGSQQTNLHPGAKFDGTFSIWYGKGPGVDRSGDVFKHATFAGTAPWGGVLACAGDDHVSKSSTLPHQSEYAFVDASVPVLNPAGVQDTLDFGLYGFAMSRFAGVWVGFKTTAEIMDSSASVEAHPDALTITRPDFEMPPSGLNIRWPDPWLEQEERLHSQVSSCLRVRSRQPDRQGGVGHGQATLGAGNDRKILSRRPAGVGRSRNRRGARTLNWTSGLQGRHALAAGA